MEVTGRQPPPVRRPPPVFDITGLTLDEYAAIEACVRFVIVKNKHYADKLEPFVSAYNRGSGVSQELLQTMYDRMGFPGALLDEDDD